MPSYALAKLHLRTDPSLREAYDQAVQDRAAFLAEELIELADEPIPKDLDPASRSAWVQNKRVRLDTRKWIAARVYRQVYGDRVELAVNHTEISITAALEAADSRLQVPPRQNCCPMNRFQSMGASMEWTWLDTDKHLKTERWPGCSRPRAPRLARFRYRWALLQRRLSAGAVMPCPSPLASGLGQRPPGLMPC